MTQGTADIQRLDYSKPPPGYEVIRLDGEEMYRRPGCRLLPLDGPYGAWAFYKKRLALIAETIAQPWPRCGGERIDGAEVWARQWTDAEVIAWLEVGVYTAAAAIRLARAGVEPREVGGEFDTDVTLGLAFTRGDVSVDRVLELRRPAREAQ